MYQNRLGPSGGIYYPNFVPCFVVVQLNDPELLRELNQAAGTPVLTYLLTLEVREKQIRKEAF